MVYVSRFRCYPTRESNRRLLRATEAMYNAPKINAALPVFGLVCFGLFVSFLVMYSLYLLRSKNDSTPDTDRSETNATEQTSSNKSVAEASTDVAAKKEKFSSVGVTNLYADTAPSPTTYDVSDSENEVERVASDEKYRIELQNEAKRMQDLYDSWPYDNDVSSYAEFSQRRRRSASLSEQKNKRSSRGKEGQARSHPQNLFVPDYYRLLPVTSPPSPTDSEGYVYG